LGVDVDRAVEEALDLVDDGFRRSRDVRGLFLDICRSWGRVAQTLRQMHEVGFLGRYLPEWDALTCLVQYDAYHSSPRTSTPSSPWRISKHWPPAPPRRPRESRRC
ncbi:MAG TPA: hypothetical protein VNS56_06315, partial [Methylomirabilota bacterium]|nr:hypothetical protein [Methylomirabilota bacterium]